jgi:signal transduction histidine kinase
MKETSIKTAFKEPELTVEDLSIALHRANLKLIEVNKKLIESEKRRCELLANISHDLRSPLTTLRGYVEYLLNFYNPDEQEVLTTLNKMHKKVLSLDYLINEILLFTKLEALDEKVKLEPIKIERFLQDFFNSCLVDTKYSQRRLSLSIPEDFPYYVLLDPEMFIRVLDNLFINALKFSDQNDEIILEAELSGRDILISVSDTGIGIDQKNISRIFERTFMVSSSRTPEERTGCGLGLSIASEIVKKHNGQIWCESTFGRGSTFYLSLPLIET